MVLCSRIERSGEGEDVNDACPSYKTYQSSSYTNPTHLQPLPLSHKPSSLTIKFNPPKTPQPSLSLPQQEPQTNLKSLKYTLQSLYTQHILIETRPYKHAIPQKRTFHQQHIRIKGTHRISIHPWP